VGEYRHDALVAGPHDARIGAKFSRGDTGTTIASNGPGRGTDNAFDAQWLTASTSIMF